MFFNGTGNINMRNGSGVQSSPGGSFPVVAATLIESTKFNNTINDINTELTRSIASDGQTTITANLPMGGFKHTGAAAGAATGEYAEYAQMVAAIAAGGFPSGTNMPFYQASPPTGWTATAIQNDSMMRVVTAAGTGGTSGAGAGHSPILNNVVTSHTHVFTGSALAAHTHTDSGHTHTVNGDNGGAGGGGGDSGRATTLLRTPITNTGFANISSVSAGTPTGTNANNAGAADWKPKYMDFCVGTKT
jgi:hypothetical protein